MSFYSNFCYMHSIKKMIIKGQLKKILSVTALTILLSTQLFPQSSGSINGKIVDATTGEELIGANIYLEGTSLGAASDLNGQYLMKGIPAGSYNLIASMIGYAKLTVTGVVVNDG
ncbi:MAG: carboxypeptidase-like regulatory domain-containing protein, partial [Ignavibacteriaceae bacterium]